MRSLISTLGAIGVVMCLHPVKIAADEVSTPGDLVRFEGAENKNCPTGAGMFTLLGSRAIFTIPRIPLVPKEAADIDADFLNNVVFRVEGLPDHSGKRFEFINTTCTIEITIRYNASVVVTPSIPR